MATLKVGQRGSVVIPAAIRERLGLEEGTLLIVEEENGAIVLRPAVAIPIEIYDMRRKAELLLNNAVDRQDYERLLEEVKKMGFDPGSIPHDPPDD